MLTTSQAAKLLGVTPRRIQAMIAAGRLPAKKHGRDWQIKDADAIAAGKRTPGRPKKG